MRFDLPKPAFVTLEIYNLLGQRVRTLLSERKAAGQHRIAWDGSDDKGVAQPSGIYLYKVFSTSSGKSESWRQIRKMVLVR
jgi:flagellar hook assembly protein FlgD